MVQTNISWNNKETLFAWKTPHVSISGDTSITVSPSQEMIIISKGEMLGPFDQGKYIASEILPDTSSNIEIWFINRSFSLDIKWGTRTPQQLKDPIYNIIIPVRAHGYLGIQIKNSFTFFKTLKGQIEKFDKKHMKDFLSGQIIVNIKNEIGKRVVKEHISILDLTADISTISKQIEHELSTSFNKFGLNIINFSVISINFPKDDESVVELKNRLISEPEQKVKTAIKTVSCDKCGKSSPVGAKFCPDCGDPFICCPKCGTDNPEGAINCSECGEVMPSECPKCKATTDALMKFCSECGETLKKSCKACSKELHLSSKFCLNCGEPV